MKISRERTFRIINASEVREWFGRSVQLSEAQYWEIASRLTKLAWPSDPPAASGSYWLPREGIDDNPDLWWDFRGSSDAAKKLLESLPPMTAHWERLKWAPETRAGSEVLKTLTDALSAAMPYIEWPLGYFERRTGRKKPKAWHTPTLIIARIIINAMIEAGHEQPGISRNSVVVRIVLKALIRMRYPDLAMITASAIGTHLDRCDKRFGLTPKGIAALTAK